MRQAVINNQPGYAKHLLVEVDWTTANASDFKGIRKQLKLEQKDWVSLQSSRSESKDILTYGAVHKEFLPRQGSAVSLAAWLASSVRDGLVVAIEPITLADNGEDGYWLCIVNHGQVVEGTDRVFQQLSDAITTADDTLEALGGEGAAYVGSAAGGSDDEAEVPDLAELLSKSGLSKARYAGAGSQLPAIIILVGAALLMVLAGGYWLISKKLAEADVAQQAKEARDRQIQRAKFEYQDILNEVGSRNHAGSSMRAIWSDTIGHTVTRIAGWELLALTCEKGSCTASYQNMDLTLPEVLKNQLGEFCESLSVSTDGTEAKCTRPYSGVALVNNGEQPVSEERLNQKLLSAGDIMDLQADFMKVAKLGDSTGYAINDAITYPFNGSRFLKGVELFNQGEWALTAPIRFYHPIAQSLGQYSGVTVEKINVNWESQIVDLRGLYFASGGNEQ